MARQHLFYQLFAREDETPAELEVPGDAGSAWLHPKIFRFLQSNEIEFWKKSQTSKN